MNVPIGRDEYDMISRRILQFAKDPYNGGVAVVYAFQFLFEMFIIKENNVPTVVKSYNINSDPVITRPYAIALTSLLICLVILHYMAVKLAYGIIQKPQRMNAFNQMTAMVETF